MPESVRRPTPLDPGKPRDADAKVDLVYFARNLAHWCDPATGLPRSWRHFVIGTTALAQLDERSKLAMYDAAVMAQTTEADKRRSWIDDVKRAAGLTTGL